MIGLTSSIPAYPREKATKSVKILLVSASSGSRGGGEFYFHGLATGLRFLGHEVDLVLSEGSHMDEFAATMQSCANVIRIPMTNTYHRRSRLLGAVLDRKGRRTAEECFRSLAPDIVHINKQNLEDGLELVLAGSSSRIPAVATIHVTRSAAELGAVAGGLRDFVTRRTLRRARLPLVGTSPTCTQDLKRFIGDNKIRCHNVTNGAFRAGSDRASARRIGGVSDTGLVIGTLARIEQQKNPLFVPKLLSQLPEKVQFLWIGDGSMREELEAEAQKLGVSDRLMITGWMPDARDLLAGLDVFVLPSLFEGFPFAILEAMSAGLPCVVSDVDGTRDSVTDNVCGHRCPVDDLPVWHAAMSQLLTSQDLREQMGAAAKARYEQEFSLETMATRTAEVYEDVIKRFRS